MNGSRREVKFLISLLQFKKLEPRLIRTMQPDASGGAGGAYRVRSLYFDTLQDDDYFDVLMGLEARKKIRLRLYPPNERPVKLEYKAKRGVDQQKISITVSHAQALQMIGGEYAFLMDLPDPVAPQIYEEMAARAYRPKILIEYQRQAYTAPGNDIRITFDTNIRASLNVSELFSSSANYTSLIAEDCGVLEVKYGGFLYTYLQNILHGLDSLPNAVSKYVLARGAMH